MTRAELAVITDALLDRGLVTGAAQVREMWETLASAALLADVGMFGEQFVWPPEMPRRLDRIDCAPFCDCTICCARMLTLDPG